ncbi:gene transfer agent family protein [Profundibacterium mesophilum]|uniref:Gene transfer agent family protein n=1 Tax=Profundibacterium mesophilum KAUST100406-0324 TaxID=1037889 RepID=A0A921NXC7_9RHOB|nr:gene transfer agent family protein [Profundibacterium mesophilum]KAF0677418.1 hypothetical protein PMES_00204 [Profundibacterium mesophilum KAUST100406-0324]
MGNPWASEVSLRLDGVQYRAKLTLGALAELEAELGTDSLVALAERFEGGTCSGRDVLALLAAGLRGGGWQGETRDLLQVDIEGGPLRAAQSAGRLLALAFAPPED